MNTNNKKSMSFMLSFVMIMLLFLPACGEKADSTDIVIVGAGGAGMSAAIEAHNSGAKVVLLEMMPMVGGNTARAEGGLNAAGTKYQEAQGIVDSPKLHFEDTMKGGKNLNNPDLVKVLTDNAKSSIEFLAENGAELSEVGKAGGSSVPRIHRPAGGEAAGNFIVVALKKKLAELKIDVRLQHTVTELVKDKDGKITGVKGTDKEGKEFAINSKAVILTTGGFGANMDMVVKNNPELAGFATTNAPGSQGTGIVMAEKVGAKLVDMKEIQIHPTTIPGEGVLITEGVRGDGAILVNQEGKRFTDELLTRDVVSKNILAETDSIAYVIFNDELRKGLKATDTYFEMGFVEEGATLAELAPKIGVDVTALEETVKQYSQFTKAGKDEAFQRDDMRLDFTKGAYYAIKVTPGIHHTMGGVVINTSTEVLNESDVIIPNLYAAGEVTGGVHGANRLGGNALADIMTFGRIAAQTAVKAIK